LPVLAATHSAGRAPSKPVSVDALTVYTPAATYTYDGEFLGLDSHAGAFGLSGVVAFADGGASPIIDGPATFIAPWALGGWSLELSPSQAVAIGCQLWDVDYSHASGAHVYLRCIDGPPQ
jgi:hypothetical protein